MRQNKKNVVGSEDNIGKGNIENDSVKVAGRTNEKVSGNIKAEDQNLLSGCENLIGRGTEVKVSPSNLF